MRRALVLLLLFPATAAATPARAPDPGLSLVGTPYLFRGDGMVRLVFRTDSALERRYDGLIGGGAIIASRQASLGVVDGAAQSAHCYTSAVRFRARVGRRYRVLIAAHPGEPAAFDLRLSLRPQHPGDARGRPLGC
jgi:hypothetical protein